MATQVLEEATMDAQPAGHMNGLDLDAMMATVQALKADPTLAKFQFRARNRWLDGGENR